MENICPTIYYLAVSLSLPLCLISFSQPHEYNLHPLLHRRTRPRCTSRLAWGKQTSSSCFCSIWPIRMPPPPTATPPSTSPLGRDRWRRQLCCWRLEPHTHWPPRYQNPNPLLIQTLLLVPKVPEPQPIVNTNTTTGPQGTRTPTH